MNGTSHLTAWGMAAIALGIAIVAGCEIKSKSDNQSGLNITPNSVEISLGEAIEFIASGGLEYDWSLEDESLGSLSTRKGDRTVYTSTLNPGSNRTSQVLTVLSFINSQSGSNVVNFHASAEAFITIVGDVPLASRVTITPSSVSIKEGETIKFSAIGGSQYNWSLANDAIGLLSIRDTEETSYTSIGDPGEGKTARQDLTVTSPEGSFTAIITHIGNETPDLTISQTKTELAKDTTADFTADGGDGTYTWSLSNVGIGLLTAQTGDETWYVSHHGTNILLQQNVIVKSAGKSTTAVITHLKLP